ncbi:hypothetical protein RFI_16615 [Reticulomyxa filosa]|uniref:UBC core domain-containing protein n=1 Tax=Reticulomyxa filosa TaxID=46433 RepID=X6N3E5_RETFI|nr:hypothetical protein RFI_16615 [Reticulomyxa filosa]|eukprot:ETO20601.1 hypothetical protein RFI_16615 [Reticulomyxa filosa]
MLTEIPFRANVIEMDDDCKMSALPSIGKFFDDKNRELCEPPKKKRKTHHHHHHTDNTYDFSLEDNLSDSVHSSDYKAWAKGTGVYYLTLVICSVLCLFLFCANVTQYGHELDKGDWDLRAWQLAQEKKDSEMLSIVTMLLEELTCKNKETHVSTERDHLCLVFEESCIVPFLKEYLRNDSLLDITQHHEKLYCTLYSIVQEMSQSPRLLPLFYDKCRSPSTSDTTLFDLLQNLYCKASLTSKFGNAAPDVYDAAKASNSVQSVSSSSSSSSSRIACNFELDHQHIPNCSNGNEAIGNSTNKKLIEDKHSTACKNDNDGDKSIETDPKTYVNAMKDLQFAIVGNDDLSFLQSHHFASMSAEINKKFITRLTFEYADLSKSLPIDVDSSVFLRVHENKMHFAKILIIPCDGTPYGGGCFIFGVFLKLL